MNADKLAGCVLAFCAVFAAGITMLFCGGIGARAIMRSAVHVPDEPQPAAAPPAPKQQAMPAQTPQLPCPIAIDSGYLSENSLGTLEIVLEVRNRTDQQIEAYVIEAECVNAFGDPVRVTAFGDHVFRGICQTALPGLAIEKHNWTLHLQRTTTDATVCVTRAKLADGTEWNLDRENATPEFYTVSILK